jgi:hypothetical protein
MLTKGNVILWMPRIVFLAIAIGCIGQYLYYISAILPFAYDWEPTDGDHVNFAHRLAQGLPIYLSIRAGEVLSIYNPLYHGIVGILGGEYASLSFARTVSFIFWALIPLTVFIYFRKKWGYFYALSAAIFIWLPAEPMMLMDIVQVSPNSTMAFLFLATLLYAEHCSENNNTQWWGWVVLGGVSALCYLAKQQGLIAFISIMTFLLIKRCDFRKLSLTVLGFLLVFIISTAYLEWANSGEYLRSTIIDLRQIMITSPSLARSRLIAFIYDANFYFVAGVIASFVTIRFRLSRFTVWHTGFILHIPFLLSMLGNGGGGPNYFITFWIVIVLICVGLVKGTESGQVAVKYLWSILLLLTSSIYFVYETRPIVFLVVLLVLLAGLFVSYKYSNRSLVIDDAAAKMKKLGLSDSLVFSQTLLILLFLNVSIATFEIRRNLNSISLPTQTLNQMMQVYYESIGGLLEMKPNARVLTNRNIGALVEHGADVKNEGATMFSYAWGFPGLFPREVLLSSIRAKKFDLITTGLQAYPEEVSKAINDNYKVAFANEINMLWGNVGLVTVYIPK